MTLGQFVIAILLGVLVWAVGSIFDAHPKNRNARLAGLVVFAVAVLAALVGLWKA
jgi:hypothetical protein